MIRKFKTLGIAMVAVLALSAVVASAASAGNFTASTYPTAATGTSAKGNDDIKTEAGSLECHTHLEVAALTGVQSEITITPSYTNCKFGPFLSATVHRNGCDFVLHTTGGIDLNCETGKAVVITASTCEWNMAPQGILSTVDLANSGKGISTQATVTGIKYTVTKDGIGCPFNGTGAKTGATYTQNSAILLSSTNGATFDKG